MNDDNPPASGGWQAQQGLRLLAVLTVLAGVLALAAAAFVFSYTPVYDIARAAGVPHGLAGFYPAVPDAVLVVACAAALALRGARWWARWLVWTTIIALVALVGAADAVHAIGYELPRRPAAAAVAVLPWALLLLGFRLWLSVLRHTRREQRLAASPAVASPASATPGPEPSRPVRPDAGAASPAGGGQSAAAADATTAGATGSGAADTQRMSPAGAAANGPAERAAAAASGPGSPITLRGLDLILPPYPGEPPEAGEPAVAGEHTPAGRSHIDAPPGGHDRPDTAGATPAPLLAAPVPDAQAAEATPPATAGPGAPPHEGPPAPEHARDEASDFRRVRSSPVPPDEPGE